MTMGEQADDTIAARLREELARRRISRQAVADMARISLSTLEKALSGSRGFTLATVIRLEEALGTPLRAASVAPHADTGLAPDHMGSYARAAVRWIEGDYVTLRPSFGQDGAVYAYRTSIFWDEPPATCALPKARAWTGPLRRPGISPCPTCPAIPIWSRSRRGSIA